MFIKIKILPNDPSSNIDDLKEPVRKIIKTFQGDVKEFQVEPIAFSLESLIVLFEIQENKDTEQIEKSLEDLDEISSIQVLDIRRAVG